MNFLTDLLSNVLSNGISGFLSNLPSGWFVVFIFYIILAVYILLPKIKKICRKIINRRRSCGDCMLIMLGISEKYRSAEDKINRNILNRKMSKVERKIEIIISELLKKYKEYQTNLINEQGIANYNIIDKEYWGYKHSMVNATYLLKMAIKKTFLENNFDKLSDKEFSMYVKDKTLELISIYENSILQDYPKDCFVEIDFLFQNFDKNWFEDIMFEIYISAKEVQLDAESRTKELERGLRDDINNFIKESSDKSRFLEYSNFLFKNTNQLPEDTDKISTIHKE
jgi:hypothetical protein